MIYLVRHGRTEFNVAGRHHGWIDSPLTQLGRSQARRAGRALARLICIENVVVFVSPLGRAVETAAIMSREAGILTPVTIDCDLREIGMGSAEGLTEPEMAQLWPEYQANSPEHMSFEASLPRADPHHCRSGRSQGDRIARRSCTCSASSLLGQLI
jgi:probable phosphoglycerate mutase